MGEDSLLSKTVRAKVRTDLNCVMCMDFSPNFHRNNHWSLRYFGRQRESVKEDILRAPGCNV